MEIIISIIIGTCLAGLHLYFKIRRFKRFENEANKTIILIDKINKKIDLKKNKFFKKNTLHD